MPRWQIREQLKKHLLDKGLNATNCEEAFANFDLDGNGCIDYTEFKHVVVGVLGIPLDVKKLRKVWRSLDQDDSNIIKYQEFCKANMGVVPAMRPAPTPCTNIDTQASVQHSPVEPGPYAECPSCRHTVSLRAAQDGELLS